MLSLRSRLSCSLCLLALGGSVCAAEVTLDFEDGTVTGWTATGDAWNGQPVKGDTVAPRLAASRPGEKSGHAGDYWIGGYEKLQDGGTGTLTSGPIPAKSPWASFLVGGGALAECRVEILTHPEGKVIFQASGRQTETMRRVPVDLRSVAGGSIVIRLVDESKAPWGHLNFDDFQFHAEEPMVKPDRVESSPVLRHLVPNRTVDGRRPEDATRNFWVPEGFRVDLIAKEPEVAQPVAFAWDERGRLWVLEAHSYPQRREKGMDRIVIFGDADGDGKFESRRVFAEALNLASGLEIGFGGVFVGAAPQLLFIPDKNGDDVPDGAPEVLLDGWGFQDTHETLNSFLWGPDGWLYGNQGVFTRSSVGKPGAPESERVTFNAGVWRFHPVTHQFELFARGGSNQWGLDYDASGHLFMTHCRSAWGGGLTSYVVQGGHYWNQSNSGHAEFVSGGAPGFAARMDIPLRNFLLASARYDHGEGGAGAPGSNAIYGGHSHVGTMIYQGDNWPEEFRGQLFTNNLHGAQMNRQRNLRDGSGYNTVHAGTDQLFADDPFYLAVDLQCGPDGAVYVIDWTDRQHCHHTSVEQWDRTNGRIYRLCWAKTWQPRSVSLREKSDGELLGLLAHRNAWFSRTARRLLQERAAEGALKPETRRLLVEGLVKESNSAAALPWLWAAEITGSLDEATLLRLLDSQEELVRSWAVRLICERPSRSAAVERFVRMAKTDGSAIVRLALASALQKLPAVAVWPLGEALAGRSEDAADRWIPGMIWYGLAPHVPTNEAKAWQIAAATGLPLLADSVVWYLSLNPTGRDVLCRNLVAADAARQERTLGLMAFALAGKNLVPAPQGWADLLPKLSAAASPLVERLKVHFGDAAALGKIRRILADANAPIPQRLDALQFLSQANDAASADTFVRLLDEPAMRQAAIPLAARFGDEKAAARLVALMEKAGAAEQVLLANALSSRPVMGAAFLGAVEAGRLPKTTISALQARQLASLGDKDIAARLERVWGKVRTGTGEAKQAVAKFRKLFDDAPLWAHTAKDGAAVFAKICAACHAWNGKGGNLGPDLGGSWRNGPEYFIENIVDPNSVVGEAYQLNVVTLSDGSVISGMATPAGDSLTVQAPGAAPRTLSKSEIKQRQIMDQSLMPAGLLEALSEKEVIDLLKFLTTAN